MTYCRQLQNDWQHAYKKIKITKIKDYSNQIRLRIRFHLHMVRYKFYVVLYCIVCKMYAAWLCYSPKVTNNTQLKQHWKNYFTNKNSVKSAKWTKRQIWREYFCFKYKPANVCMQYLKGVLSLCFDRTVQGTTVFKTRRAASCSPAWFISNISNTIHR